MVAVCLPLGHSLMLAGTLVTMSVKGHLHRLADAEILEDAQLERLRRYSITTVEELFGVVQANPASVASLLGIDLEEVSGITAKLTLALDPEVMKAYEESALDPDEYGFGGRSDPPPATH